MQQRSVLQVVVTGHSVRQQSMSTALSLDLAHYMPVRTALLTPFAAAIPTALFARHAHGLERTYMLTSSERAHRSSKVNPDGKRRSDVVAAEPPAR